MFTYGWDTISFGTPSVTPVVDFSPPGPALAHFVAEIAEVVELGFTYQHPPDIEVK